MTFGFRSTVWFKLLARKLRIIGMFLQASPSFALWPKFSILSTLRKKTISHLMDLCS